MASSLLEIPTFKGRAGWEFTDLSGLDLDAYAPGTDLTVDVGRSVNDLTAHGPLWDLTMTALPAGVVQESSADETTITIERGVVIREPIPVTIIQTETGARAGHRINVAVEEGAQAEVWVQYLSEADDVESILDADVDLVVGDGARLRFVTGQNLSERSWIFGTQRASVGRSAVLDWVALGFGSRSGHVTMNTRLVGDGAEARVTGAYATRGRQHIDFDTTQEHAAPNTTSDLAFRGVLQDRSSAVWKGNIIVDPGAQKTDAFQDSRNLLLSKKAHADAIPGLEIQANDVRCTHAAAVAQVDPEQLFYLMSHGLPEADAKQLVIEGFLAALVQRFEAGPVREVLAAALEHRLQDVLGA